jgi:prepilin-type N-terminal cleavage/methylation domain-containing protein
MHPCLNGARARRGGFTLVEVLVATTLLGLVAGGALWALTQANNYASISRLYTGAETAAQNQIDFLLSDAPFNPQTTPPQLGSEVLPSTSPPTYTWTLGAHAAQDVTIYTEPSGADGQSHAVIGQMVTTVTSNNVVTKSQNLNLYSATVVVTYTFRSKTYRVQLNAMRASDV